jgi:hypothetical protein
LTHRLLYLSDHSSTKEEVAENKAEQQRTLPTDVAKTGDPSIDGAPKRPADHVVYVINEWPKEYEIRMIRFPGKLRACWSGSELFETPLRIPVNRE